jgi:hypothetical protein
MTLEDCSYIATIAQVPLVVVSLWFIWLQVRQSTDLDGGRWRCAGVEGAAMTDASARATGLRGQAHRDLRKRDGGTTAALSKDGGVTRCPRRSRQPRPALANEAWPEWASPLNCASWNDRNLG